MDAMAKNIWVSGAVMNEMLAASGCGKVTPEKFAYDHTTKSACTVRGAVSISQFSQEPEELKF